MSLESGRDLSMEQLKELNKKPQALSMNSEPQSTPTPEAPAPEQTRTPMPQPIVIQCAIPEGMERLERQLRMLEQFSNTQVNLLRTLAQNTNSNPTGRQMDALVKQMDGLQKQVAHLEKMAEQAGKPKEKRFSMPKFRLPRLHLTLPEWDWPTAVTVAMGLAMAALLLVWWKSGGDWSSLSLLRR